MTDTRIATAYLTGMFAMLAAKHINPAQVDWAFAAECWDTVKNENERLHQCIRIAAESTDSFMRASEQLRAERDELLDALIPLANASMPDERALISDEDQERAAALVAKLENRTDD